jgi:predicted MFS family arabinose efflux permease
MFASIPLQGARRGTIGMMALACSVMVANIYLCQPLLAEIAASFGVPASMAALVAVATQIGYTLGILFVVPLADNVDPKKLVGRLLVLSAIGLVGAAFAPHLGLLLVASLLIASTSIVAQVLMPLATTLATSEYCGRVVSALSTGLILGILLSRTVSGLVAGATDSWRAPFLLQAVLVLALRFVLPGFLPARSAVASSTGYFALLRSLLPLLRHAPLRLSLALSFCAFAAFSALWATLAFQLASPAFKLGPGAAGLFGLWGAAGALLAPVAGRLSDRWGPSRVNMLSLIALIVSFGIALTWGTVSIAALIITVNLLDFGTQSGQVANQTRIFGLGDTIRGRLNTLYMVTTFAGGASGALTGGWAWSFAGWHGVCLLCCALIGVAALVLVWSSLTTRAPSAQAV